MGEQICSGKFMPGDILPAEPVLAEQMQVSRITIRETMKSLSAKGMLQVRRRYGTIVLPRSQWQLRLIIEPNAARLAAKRATPEERVAVRRAFKAMERAVAGHGEYVPADLAFHGAILAACHNQFVQQMQNALSAILRTSFELSSEIAGGPARSLPMHEALCVAIENGDPEAAEQAVLTLIERAEQDFEDRAALNRAANDQPA
jgi:GntR family galactonate operon transcriptional repressor